MAFYIRKAFKTGPVRLNLSKGGLGLSAGVTGARVGINTRGLYVHGGRHGLYYRKYAKSGKGRASRHRSTRTGGPQSARPQPVNETGGTVDLFRDTGVTYTPKLPFERTPPRMPALAPVQLMTWPLKVILAVSVVLLLIALGAQTTWLLLIALLTAAGALCLTIRNGVWKQRMDSKLKKIVTRTESDGALPDGLSMAGIDLPEQWKDRLSLQLHSVIGELAMRDERIDTIPTLQALDERVPTDRSQVDHIRAVLLGTVIDEMLEDHLLSEEEEQAIRRLLEQLQLPEELSGPEIARLEYYSEIRRQIERPLEAIDPGVPLVRGERAYERFEPARLLNERVMDRFRRDNVQYRELGYEIDLEGELVLTDRRLLFAGRGSREYRLNRILDITADPEAGIVELTLSGRKSPVLITAPEPMVLAARIEKVVELHCR